MSYFILCIVYSVLCIVSRIVLLIQFGTRSIREAGVDMARTGVTFEQVVEAAKAIADDGENPTIQRVRLALGTGSPNTIHKHLRQWIAQSRPDKPAVLKLPEKIQDALIAEISRQASEARAEAESEAQEAMSTADELAEQGEMMEKEIEAMKARVVSLEQSQIEDGVKISAKDEEIERLRHELRIEREECEKIRLELNEDKHMHRAVCDQVSSLKGQLAEALDELSSVRDELKSAESTATHAEAQRQAQKEKVIDCQDRIEELKEQVTTLRDELKASSNAKDKLTEEVSSLKVQLASSARKPASSRKTGTKTTAKTGKKPQA